MLLKEIACSAEIKISKTNSGRRPWQIVLNGQFRLNLDHQHKEVTDSFSMTAAHERRTSNHEAFNLSSCHLFVLVCDMTIYHVRILSTKKRQNGQKHYHSNSDSEGFNCEIRAATIDYLKY
ncbi:hypothetical protein TNCT_234851 [Trichonephila clavata]|uniref:Uncharacterized protein n=1 Tax=Trichonephila clavata TaxID=2740835 RepID=A0A8X6JY11_TRICU|nr:hypothetical protein TNCT_234851 [Trichonephila clavata]